MKKLLSLILALSLLLSVAPAALSDEEAPEETVVSSETAPETVGGADESAAGNEDPVPAGTGEEEEPVDEKPTDAEETPSQEGETPSQEGGEENPACDREDNPVGGGSGADQQEQVPVPAVTEGSSGPEAGSQEESAPKDNEDGDADKVEDKDAVILENADPDQTVNGENGAEPEKESEPDEALPGLAMDESEIDENATAPDRLKKITLSNMSSKGVTLGWSAVTTPFEADGYEIRWGKVNDFNAKSVADSAFRLGANETNTANYFDGQLTCGVTYYFFVRAFYVNAQGNPSAWAKPLMKSYTPAPGAPDSDDFDIGFSPNSAVKLVLAWGKVDEADGYNVYSDVDGVKTIVATLNKNPDRPTVTISGIKPAEKLKYRVYSYKTVSGKQIESTESAVKEFEYYIPSPADLQTVSVGADSVKLTWKAMGGATKYVVERNDGGDEYEVISEQKGTTFTDTGLTFGRIYTYYVTAWIDEWEGETTSGVDGQATGVAPGNVKVVNADSTNSNTITWDNCRPAEGYLLEWSDAYDSSNPGGTQWITIDVGNQLSYVHQGLTVGTEYAYRVTGYVNYADPDDPQTVSKVKTPTSKVVTVVAKPARPVIASLTNENSTTQVLEWYSVAGITGYEMQYSTSSTFATVMATVIVPAPEGSPDTVAADHQECTNAKTYYYRVRAYVEVPAGADGGVKKVNGAYSATKALKCAPAIPENIVAEYDETAGVNSVSLRWSNADGATDFQIFSKENDAAWTLVTTVKATQDDTQQYTVKNLNVGSEYSFAVKSVRTYSKQTAVGQLGYAAPEKIELNVKPYTPEQADPAYTVVDRTKVILYWKKANGISQYEITGECAEDESFKGTFGTKRVTSTKLTVSGLKPGYSYTFTIRSRVVVNGTAEYSDPVVWDNVVPTSLAPATLTVKADTKHYGAVLSWTKSDGATGYVVEKSSSQDGPWTAIAQIVGINELTYNDTKLDDNHSYSADQAGSDPVYYRVKSYIDHGGMQPSKATAAASVQIRVPTPVIALTSIDKTEIEVEVTNYAEIQKGTGPWKYEIYRSKKSGSGYTLMDVVTVDDAETAPVWTDDGANGSPIAYGTVYYYKVLATVKNEKGSEPSSSYSAVKSEQGKLKPVEGVFVSDIHGGSVLVGWDSMEAATSGYDVFYRVKGTTAWKLFGSAGRTAQTKLVTGLNPKTTYEFAVAGKAKAGTATIRGNYSEAPYPEATTAIEPVIGLTVTPSTYNSLKLTWTKVQDATSYQVFLEDPANPGVWVKKKTLTGTSVTLTSLGKNKKYNFFVRAIVSKNGITDATGTGYKPSAMEDTESGYTAPAKVTGLKASSIGKTALVLSFTGSSGANGYLVERFGPDQDMTTDVPEWQTDSNRTSYPITGLVAGTKYRFRVTPYGIENEVKLWGASAVYAVTTKNQ